MKSFINISNLIRWTPDYPKKGIEFADLSRALNHPDTRALSDLVAQNFGIEKDCVVVGIPSRGCLWANILAASANTIAIQLQKQGVGTPLPNSIEFCKSETVYSDNKPPTVFLIDPDSIDSLKKASRIIICDDVTESAKTFKKIIETVQSIATKSQVICIPFLAAGEVWKTILPGICFPVLQTTNSSNWNKIMPSTALMIRSEKLATLRGVPSIPKDLNKKGKGFKKATAVYGLPSMNDQILNYIANKPNAFVGDIMWDTFSGGVDNIHFNDYKTNIVFLYDAASKDLAQNYVVDALARNCSKRMKIIILYLPQATMERVDIEGTLAVAHSTLHALCAKLPQTAKGKVVVEILDIHQTGTRFYLSDDVQYRPRSIMLNLIDDNVQIIAYPDDGARKRFGHLFDGRTQVICEKIREGDKRYITIKETIGPLSVAGNTVTILDDLTRTYGTLVATAEALLALGATSINVVFVHADFDPGRTYWAANHPAISKIICSDSCPEKARILKLLGGDRVVVKSAFGFKTNCFECKNDKIFAVTSEEENKIKAAYNVLNHSTSYTTKFLSNTYYRGLYSLKVDSRVPEQPVGKEEGLKGAVTRAVCTNYLFPNWLIISFESFMMKIVVNEQEIWQDTVCAITMQNSITKGKGFDASAIPPQDIANDAIAKKQIVGELLMKKYGLSDKAKWIYYFSKNRRSRIQQLEAALAAAYNFYLPQLGR